MTRRTRTRAGEPLRRVTANVIPSHDDVAVSTTATSPADLARSAPALGRDTSAAIAGIVATATALGVSELLAGLLAGATSLVASVGQVVIDLQPSGAKDVVVALFGTNDKLALELFIVAVALVVGAGLGLVARRRFMPSPPPSSSRSASSGSWRRSTIRWPTPASPARCVAISIGLGLWVLGWLLDRSGATAPVVAGGSGDRPTRRPGRADARLVASVVPDAGRRRSGSRAVGAGYLGRTLLEGGRVAPVGNGPADPARIGHGPTASGRRRPGDLDRRPDADRRAERRLLPDRHVAADPERQHGRLDAPDPRPGRPRDDADLGAAHRAPDVRAVRDDRVRQQRGRRRSSSATRNGRASGCARSSTSPASRRTRRSSSVARSTAGPPGCRRPG